MASPTTKVVQVQNPWFRLIKECRKRVEGKIGPEGDFKTGDVLKIRLPDRSEKLRVRVTDVRR